MHCTLELIPFRKLLVLFALSLFWNSELYAQLDTIHYIPPVHGRGIDAYTQHYIYLSTPSPNPLPVTIETGTGTLLYSGTVSNANPVVYHVGTGTNNPMVVIDNQLSMPIGNKGIVVSASDSIYANYRVAIPNSSNVLYQAGSLTAKGRPALGTTFRIGGMPNFGTQSNRSSFFALMARDNNTTVQLSQLDPGFNPINGGIAGGQATFVLQAGEVIVFSQLPSTVPNQDGQIGGLVQADKPVVLSNGFCLGNLPGNPTGLQDIGLDEAVPVNRIGQEYIAVRGGGGDNMEQLLILAHQDSTYLFVNGSATPAAMLMGGEYFLIHGSNYSINNNLHVFASKAVYCYQKTAGTNSEATGALNFLPPLTCQLPNMVNNIPLIEFIGTFPFNGGLQIITGANDSISVMDNNGTTFYNAQSGDAVPGTSQWKTYKINNFSGNTSVFSSGPLAVGLFGANNVAGFAGFYSGFDAPPTIDLVLQGDSCENSGLLFVNDGFDSYQWHYNGQAISGATNDTLILGNAGDYYVITSKNNCTDSSSMFQPLTIYNLPQAGFVLPDSCGLFVQFNDSSQVPPPSQLNQFLWDFGDGQTGMGANPGHTYASPGHFTVWLHIQTDKGCKDSLSQQITIHPQPQAAFDFQDACAQSLVTFQDQSNPNFGQIQQWFWQFGNGQTDTAQHPSFTFTQPGSFLVQLTVTGIGGCTDTLSDSLHIFPKPQAAFLSGDSCGLFQLFTNQSTIAPPGNITSYLWQFGDGAQSNQTHPGHLYNSPGIYPLVLTVGSDMGCSDTFQVDVPVFAVPNAQFAPAEGCHNQAVQLNDSSFVAGNGILTWYWDFGNGDTGNGQNPTYTYPLPGTHPIQLIVTGPGGCSDTAEAQIHLLPGPTADFFVPDSCGLLSYFIDSSSVPLPGQIASHTWDFGNGSGSNQTNPQHPYSQPGQYLVTLVVETSDGCLDTLQSEITAADWPTADFASLTGCFMTNHFSDLSSGGIPPYQFTWDIHGDGQSESQSMLWSYTFPQNQGSEALVNLHLVDAKGCWADTQKTVTLLPSPPYFTFPNVLVLNPEFEGNDRIDFQLLSPAFNQCLDYHLSIFNRWGTPVFVLDHLAGNDYGVECQGCFQGKHNNGSVLSQGVYYYLLQVSDSTYNQQGQFHVFAR